VRAVVAFFSGVRVRIDVERVVRASLHAGLAADAAVAVEIYYAVCAAKKRSHGADCYARRIVAVIAPHHRKEAARVRVFALFDVLHPRAKRAERDFVFRFAGDRASVTADAFSVVNYKAVSHVFEFNVSKALLDN
jgi:hypothetical protein